MLNKKLLAGIAGAVALGLAVPAMAEDVTVNIAVEDTALISAQHDEIFLVLDGTQGIENYDTAPSSLTHTNNTAATISVAVATAGTPALPVDLTYWLFRDMTVGDAETAIEGDELTSFANGIFRFSGAQVNTGVAATPFADLTVASDPNGTALPVVYAADARNSLPPPNDHVTTVTWTIAPVSGD